MVADSRYIAEDAAALVAVDYDIQPFVADVRKSASGAPVRRELNSNVITTYKVSFGDTDAAFAKAAHVFKQELWQHRGAAHSIEARGTIAEIRSADGGITVHASTQKAHDLQQTLTTLLDMDESLRVAAPDIGGGFGAKLCVYSEDVAVVAAAKLLNRSLKWIEDRREYFTNAVHERDQYWALEIAVDGEARVLGIRGKLLHDTGAYTVQDPNIPYNSASTMSGPYAIPSLNIDVTIAMTNKTPVSSVRGAGYPQASFAMERLLDLVSREMKLDRAEVRRRNLIPPQKMPYQKPIKARSGVTIQYDSGDYPACQAEVLDGRSAGTVSARGRQAARKAGRHLGIGLSHGVKGTGRGPFESGLVRISRTGKITVFTGASAMGQGLATAMAQIAASQLGVPVEQIKVVAGDTSGVSLGLGGFASRQTVTAGSSVHLAAKAVADKAKKVASHMLEAAEHDLELAGGEVRVVGAPQLNVKLAEIARILQGAPGYGFPPGVDPGLEFERHAPHRSARLRQRLPRRRGRGRHRDRRGENPALCRAAGLRRADQSDDGRGPGPRRRRARHRQHVLRMDGLRRRRPAGDHVRTVQRRQHLHDERHLRRRLVPARHGDPELLPGRCGVQRRQRVHERLLQHDERRRGVVPVARGDREPGQLRAGDGQQRQPGLHQLLRDQQLHDRRLDLHRRRRPRLRRASSVTAARETSRRSSSSSPAPGNLQLMGSVESNATGADQVDVTSPTVLTANTWNHFALVVDRSGGQQLRIHVNGGRGDDGGRHPVVDEHHQLDRSEHARSCPRLVPGRSSCRSTGASTRSGSGTSPAPRRKSPATMNTRARVGDRARSPMVLQRGHRHDGRRFRGWDHGNAHRRDDLGDDAPPVRGKRHLRVHERRQRHDVRDG